MSNSEQSCRKLRGWFIGSINHRPTPTLEALWRQCPSPLLLDRPSRELFRFALGCPPARNRELCRTVDGFDDRIGREVMDHVAETGKSGQFTLRDLLVQPLRLTAHIGDLVVPTR